MGKVTWWSDRVTYIYMTGLNSKLTALHQDLKDTAAAGSSSTWMLFDAWSKFTHILDHPQKYGLTNTTGYCPDW